MDLNQIKRLYHTLKYLKFTQVYHQIEYRLIKAKRVNTALVEEFSQVDLIDFPEKQKSFSIENNSWSFSFLNLKQSFSEDSIDWSFGEYGMLWTYNLNYFDWLHQAGMSKEQGIETLRRFYTPPVDNNLIVKHPYPTSLRIINAAKFIARWDIKEDWLYSELLFDLKLLSGRLEYHLLANHLLENAFALYFGGLITNQEEFIQKGKKLLARQLKEQILNDGMHFERSPMYHLIILERLLDALNFAKATKDELEPILKSYAIKMTGFVMNWEDLYRIPMMQDSAYGIALTVPVILDYSRRLLSSDYPNWAHELRYSGYRKLKNESFEVHVNVGEIGPSYQPGHAHADELNFELFYQGKPIVVDTGISTYEKNQRRQLERSTESHNCLVINSENSSDVWSGFRVGKRAKVELIHDNDFKIAAQHFGYSPFVVKRTWEVVNESIVIYDELKNTSKSFEAKGKLHLHPSIKIEQLDNCSYKLSNNLLISFESLMDWLDVSVGQYQYCQGYNNTLDAVELVYACPDKMKITIREAN